MRLLANQVSSPSSGSESGSVQALLRETPVIEVPSDAAGRFHSKAAESRLLLCALWALGPRSPSSGAPYTMSDLTANLSGETTPTDALQRFFPRAPRAGKRAGNRFILLGDDPIDSSAVFYEKPTALSESDWHELLKSHAMTPELSALLRVGDHVEFLERRDQAINSLAQAFANRMAEPQHDDTRPLQELDLDDESAGDEVALIGQP